LKSQWAARLILMLGALVVLAAFCAVTSLDNRHAAGNERDAVQAVSAADKREDAEDRAQMLEHWGRARRD